MQQRWQQRGREPLSVEDEATTQVRSFSGPRTVEGVGRHAEGHGPEIEGHGYRGQLGQGSGCFEPIEQRQRQCCAVRQVEGVDSGGQLDWLGHQALITKQRHGRHTLGSVA